VRRNNLLYAMAGLVAGATLTLATIAYTAPTVSADESENAMKMAQKAQVMAVTFQLDKSGLHDIDVSLTAGTMPAGALGNVRRARIATQATDWPESMQGMASDLAGHMIELEEALRAEDVTRAAPLAKKVHDLGHDVSAASYTMLSGGPPAPTHSD
jgi:hypothetical protein